jgi:PadR family transcriptional regulator PadR
MKGDHVGEFEELVLLAVRGLGDDAYGASVQETLELETTRSVSLGAVYAALDRLERKGLLRSAMAQGTAVRGGRSRRVFLLTAQGVRTIGALRRIRLRLYDGLEAKRARSHS